MRTARSGSSLTILGRPKLLIIDELGCLPFEQNAARLFFVRRSSRFCASHLDHQRQIGNDHHHFGGLLGATLSRCLRH